MSKVVFRIGIALSLGAAAALAACGGVVQGGGDWNESDEDNVGAASSSLKLLEATPDRSSEMELQTVAGGEQAYAGTRADQGWVSFVLEVSLPGTYVLSARVSAPHQDSNSFFVDVGSAERSAWEIDPPDSSHRWRTVRRICLPAGRAEVRMGVREPGTLISAIRAMHVSTTCSDDTSAEASTDGTEADSTAAEAAETEATEMGTPATEAAEAEAVETTSDPAETRSEEPAPAPEEPAPAPEKPAPAPERPAPEPEKPAPATKPEPPTTKPERPRPSEVFHTGKGCGSCPFGRETVDDGVEWQFCKLGGFRGGYYDWSRLNRGFIGYHRRNKLGGFLAPEGALCGLKNMGISVRWNITR
jgi:hypothetical protein